MKNKTLITIATCLLFILAGLSAFAGGERVYIRQFGYATGRAEIVIYEKGAAKTIAIENPAIKKEEALTSFAEILEKYFQKGYKLLSATTMVGGYTTEYILEKQ